MTVADTRDQNSVDTQFPFLYIWLMLGRVLGVRNL